MTLGTALCELTSILLTGPKDMDGDILILTASVPEDSPTLLEIDNSRCDGAPCPTARHWVAPGNLSTLAVNL